MRLKTFISTILFILLISILFTGCPGVIEMEDESEESSSLLASEKSAEADAEDHQGGFR